MVVSLECDIGTFVAVSLECDIGTFVVVKG